MSSSRPSIRLSCLLRELENAGYDCNDLTYRRTWMGAVEGRFPAHQINGVWHFTPEDAPTIGAALGLKYKQVGSATGNRATQKTASGVVR
jgi:hypothetical protein